MRRFQLLEPRSIEEACGLLDQHPDAKPIAGGTALLILIKQGVYLPTTLINLKKIHGASDVAYDSAGGLRIGALATINDVAGSAAVREHYPVLASACHVVANVRIRNLATIGGNLAHADNQSDPPTALLALGARVELTCSRGTRDVNLSDFLFSSYETALQPGEVLSAVLVPPQKAGLRGTYLKFTTRSSEDRPCAGVAALVDSRNGTCDELRLVVGAVSPTPVRVEVAEAMARGARLTPDLIEAMAGEAAKAVEPIDDLRGPADYKRHLVGALTRRALETCATNGVTR